MSKSNLKNKRSHKYLAYKNPNILPKERNSMSEGKIITECLGLQINFDFNIQLCVKIFQTFQSFLKQNPSFSKRASQAANQKTSTFNHKYIKGLGLIEDQKKNVYPPGN